MSRSITILKPGLQSCVQELPGRLGFLEQGFPVSGPFDDWSFRQANILVGNHGDTAAMECQFVGPSLRLEADCLFAVTGADMVLARLPALSAGASRALPSGVVTNTTRIGLQFALVGPIFATA